MSELAADLGDLGIPTLPAVLNPVELAQHLDLPSFSPWRWDASRQVRVRLLKWDQGDRCTLEIGLRTETGWQEVIGKVYAKDRADVYQAMQGLRRAGFVREAEFSIPQPLVYVPSLRLLLLEKVEGLPANQVFLKSSERGRDAASERCARWLAQFQTVAPRSGPLFQLADHLSNIERWSRHVAKLGEPFADGSAQLFRRIQTAATALREIELCAGHGEYSYYHIIFAGQRTVTFDWDSYRVADPAYDVARFATALQRLALGHLGSIRALDRPVEVFVKTYLATGGRQVELHLPFYKAATCLQIAKGYARRRVNGWEAKVEAVLNEGLRVLEEHANR